MSTEYLYKFFVYIWRWHCYSLCYSCMLWWVDLRGLKKRRDFFYLFAMNQNRCKVIFLSYFSHRLYRIYAKWCPWNTNCTYLEVNIFISKRSTHPTVVQYSRVLDILFTKQIPVQHISFVKWCSLIKNKSSLTINNVIYVNWCLLM
jgi:hypothetical protein